MNNMDHLDDGKNNSYMHQLWNGTTDLTHPFLQRRIRRILWKAGLVQELLRSRGKGLGFCEKKMHPQKWFAQTKSSKSQKWQLLLMAEILHQLRLVVYLIYL